MRLWQLVTICAAGVLMSCADLELREVDIKGKVLLQGQASGHHGGTTVTLDRTTSTTDSGGGYSLSGYVGAADDYILVFSHAGYTSRQVTGKFSYDPNSKPSDKITLSVDTVTLLPVAISN